MPASILLVSSSPRGAAAHSTALAERLVGGLRTRHPEAVLARRDLAAAPPPHIDAAFVEGQHIAPEARTEAQRAAIARSDAYGAELAAADTIVIAAAMINFSIPTTLRAWFDHVLRAGLTFRYTSKGSVGTMGGRKAYLVLARGGIYTEGRFSGSDFQLPYLRVLLGFMGIDDVAAITLDGAALGPEPMQTGLAAAEAQIAALLA